MRDFPRLSRCSTAFIALLFVVATGGELNAQSTPPSAPAKPAAPEEMNQTELVETYRNMREQLRAAQTAIVNNRFEFEATSRAQAAALAEKIEAMNAILATERKARQAESDRLDFERERQQADIQRSNRTVIWIASAFGSIGLLAMLLAALFQWRAINRMAQVIDQRPQLPAPGELSLLPSGPASGQPVALSTRRLMSTIERMEQRIKELEQTTVPPLADIVTKPPGQAQETLA